MKTQGVSEGNEELERLLARLSFLTALFDGIEEEILVVDGDYTVIDANRFFLERAALEKGEALGRKCYELPARRGCSCKDGRIFCPLPKAKETGERVEATHVQQSPEGALEEITRLLYPLALEGGKPGYFMEISREVTEYRNLINRLRASEKRFRAVLDNATDAVISVGGDRSILLFNDAAQRIFRYGREELIGRPLDLILPPQAGEDYRYLETFLEGGLPNAPGKALSLRGLRKGGERFPVEMGLSHLQGEGGVTFTAIVRDVSLQRQMEKKLLQSERLAAVGQAVAYVAHEIRTPLMVIGGFSQQIKRCLEDEKSAMKAEMILEEVRRLENLVEDLLHFTREHKLLRTKVDVGSLLRDVLGKMAGIAVCGKHCFVEDFSSDPREISCDPDRLKQVFINILTNAAQSMPDGGTIRVCTEWLTNHLEIRVQDEGDGIAESDLQHIFDPFFTTREHGSGLGLAISYKIIAAHAGEIWAESRPGEGTTFFVRLPRDPE